MKKFDHQSGQSLHVDDTKIYYEETGNSHMPVLLLLHGGFGTIEDFNSIIPDLVDKFRVIGIDSRGHGKSTLGTKKLTYEQIRLDVEAILQLLKVNELIIMGLSDGGVVAYRLAALSQLKIKKIITIGANGSADDLAYTKSTFFKITAQSWKEKFPETVENYQRINPIPDFDLFTKSVKQLWLDDSDTGYPNGLVKQITCPSLIIRGDNDKLFSRESATQLAGSMPNSVFFNIPLADHACFDDQPELFKLGVRAFLSH